MPRKYKFGAERPRNEGRFKKLSITNLRDVLERLADQAECDKGDAMVIVRAADDMLSELADGDFFGTEGQLDPRGDRRG